MQHGIDSYYYDHVEHMSSFSGERRFCTRYSQTTLSSRTTTHSTDSHCTIQALDGAMDMSVEWVSLHRVACEDQLQNRRSPLKDDECSM